MKFGLKRNSTKFLGIKLEKRIQNGPLILIQKIILQWFNYSTESPIFRKNCRLIVKGKCLQRHVLIAKMNAKFPLNQRTIDQFIVENVFKIINPKKEVVVLDLVEDHDLEEMTEVLDSEEVQEETDHGKCSQQPALIATMSAKFHLNQKKIGQFIVTSVFKIINKVKTI